MNFGDLFHVSSLLALNSCLPLTVLSHIKDSGDCNVDRGKYVFMQTHILAVTERPYNFNI